MTRVARVNQRMIYVSDENTETYDNLESKSEWINEQLRKLRNDKPVEANDEFEAKIKKLRGED